MYINIKRNNFSLYIAFASVKFREVGQTGDTFFYFSCSSFFRENIFLTSFSAVGRDINLKKSLKSVSSTKFLSLLIRCTADVSYDFNRVDCKTLFQNC